MLQDARVTALTVSELLRESQQGAGVKLLSPPPHLDIITDRSIEVCRNQEKKMNLIKSLLVSMKQIIN